jgi:FkbM family methyltransferase|mmetsp:Transcript_105164/g.165968  ORF Transcript_105164/g.165968 Transcript_105164/m.165968 type:complete len:287 (-) Transcript_105164:109-969(-)
MLSLKIVVAVGSLIARLDAAVFGRVGKIEVAPKTPATLRGAVISNATAMDMPHALTAVNSTRHGNSPPCSCVSSNPDWTPCARTTPRCVFIDLGAADGNTFEHFVHNGYGYVDNCPSGQWSAILVEANPRFDAKLSEEKKAHNTEVTVLSSTAAYMCEGTTSFYLDTVNTARNYWGSSMSSSHPDVQRSGQEKVTVPTINLNRILYEQTIPDDWVMVKMDIEGSEFDVLPCLAKQDSPASLIDRLYLEQHSSSWGMVGTTDAEMESVKNELKFRGVDIPPYFSQTL